MTEEFDLKKYLAQNTGPEENLLADMLTHPEKAEPIVNYLAQTQMDGMTVIRQYLTLDEISTLLDILTGSVAANASAFLRDNNDDTKAMFIFMATHTKAVRAIIACSLMFGIAVGAKEEWR